ncbi:MAG: hypothetical protein ACI9EW_000600 [Cellvibrionaceae bacterium]|jgi:hypothetical protein
MVLNPLFKRHYLAYILLLLAFVLRVYSLDSLPPGLTHDEANHGHEALEVLSGFFRYYFPLGYGREPLYAYLLAGWMRLVGVSIFSLRLLIPMGMILCHAAVYRWVNKLFGQNTALLTLAILAIAWWPLVASRQALRSGLLPLITIGLAAATTKLWDEAQKERPVAAFLKAVRLPVISIAALIGFMLHTYIAARVLWVFIPAFGAYLILFDRKSAARFWLASFPAVIGGLLLSAPLFIYLRNNPGLETRLDMLDGPIQALLSGDVIPILQNVWKTCLGLIWPGRGDKFLAYSIPGKPTLAPLTAIFFIIGSVQALINWRKPEYVLLLLWLGVGLAPSLITGPTAATTRSMGALLPIYILAALGIKKLYLLTSTGEFPSFAFNRRSIARVGYLIPTIYYGGGIAIWLVSAAFFSLPIYFLDWGQRPDVRAAYQSTMIDALENMPPLQPNSGRMISSVLPGHAHDPTIAEVVISADKWDELRWADGRFALIIPAGVEQLEVIAPSSADLHPFFRQLVIDETQIKIRPDDLDRFWTAYTLTGWEDTETAIGNFNQAIELNEVRWLADAVPPNGVAELLTVWTVLDPTKLGSTIPYVGYPEPNVFVHILRPDGTILNQADRLDAPAWDWQPGDRVMQIHQIYIPADVELGSYAAVIGVYDRLTAIRLPVSGSDETLLPLPSLEIRN